MNSATDALAYELRHTHHHDLTAQERARADVLAGRRRARRHRLADRFRSVADRLDS